MAVSFNVDSYYNENESFSRVIFGAESPLLEAELNELQQIMNTKLKRVMSILGNGLFLTDEGSIEYEEEEEVFKVSNALIVTNGLTAYVPEHAISLHDGNILCVRLSESVATLDTVLHEYGNEDAHTVENTIQDPRVLAETTRRKFISYLFMEVQEMPDDTGTEFYLKIGSVQSGKFIKDSIYFLNFSKEIEELKNRSSFSMVFDDENSTIIFSDTGGSGGGGGGSYVLPIASSTRLGGVKIGTGIDITPDGTINPNVDASAERAADIAEESISSSENDFTEEDIDDIFN